MLKILGHRITEGRKRKDLSQAKLGEIIGKSRDVVGRYERGDVSPSIETVVAISKALEVSMDYLTGQISIELDRTMLERVEEISKMSEEEKEIVYHIIDALIVKHKVQ